MERYFDYAATTPPDPCVVDRMSSVYREVWANPSSAHSPGRKAGVLLERLRTQLTHMMGGNANWIPIFTAGGTEADNLALIGVALASLPSRNHIIISNVEHAAVRNAAKFATRFGTVVEVAPVDTRGCVDLDWLRKHLLPRTALVSVMTANNEIGTIQPVSEIAKMCREANVPFHTDAVQALGNLPLSLTTLGADLVSVSAHKVYGPRGVGALFVRKGVPIHPILYGGDQEYGLRGGTENLPGIAGFVEAVRMVLEDMPARVQHMRELRNQLICELMTGYPEAVLNSPRDNSHPGIVHFSLPDAPSDTWIAALDAEGFCVSSGSACHSGAAEPSPVLQAIGVPPHLALCALRFSLGRHSTSQGVTALVAAILTIRDRIRASSRPNR